MTDANAVAPPTPGQRGKLTLFQKLERRVRADPAVFGFLSLTVAALTGGMASLLRDDKRQSQLMMRARVGFQFCTIAALVGGIYYRECAHRGQTSSPPQGSPHPRSPRALLSLPASRSPAQPSPCRLPRVSIASLCVNSWRAPSAGAYQGTLKDPKAAAPPTSADFAGLELTSRIDQHQEGGEKGLR